MKGGKKRKGKAPDEKKPDDELLAQKEALKEQRRLEAERKLEEERLLQEKIAAKRAEQQLKETIAASNARSDYTDDIPVAGSKLRLVEYVAVMDQKDRLHGLPQDDTPWDHVLMSWKNVSQEKQKLETISIEKLKPLFPGLAEIVKGGTPVFFLDMSMNLRVKPEFEDVFSFSAQFETPYKDMAIKLNVRHFDVDKDNATVTLGGEREFYLATETEGNRFVYDIYRCSMEEKLVQIVHECIREARDADQRNTRLSTLTTLINVTRGGSWDEQLLTLAAVYRASDTGRPQTQVYCVSNQ